MVVAAVVVQAEAAAIRAMLVQTVLLVTPVPMVVALRRVLRVAPEMLVQTEMLVTQVLTAQARLLALLVVRVTLGQMVTQAQALQTVILALAVPQGTRQLLVT